MPDAAAVAELEDARQATAARQRQAHCDLAEQRAKLAEAENLRTVVRKLHVRNHVADDISKLIAGTGGGRP